MTAISIGVTARQAIIDACGGDLHQAARVIHHQQAERGLQLWRLRQPWPEEGPTLQDELERLRARVSELEAEKANQPRPLTTLTKAEPVKARPKAQAKGCVPL